MDKIKELSLLSKEDEEYVKAFWDGFTYIDGMTLKDVFCLGVGVGRGLVIPLGD